MGVLSARDAKRLDKLLALADRLPEIEISGRERLHESGRGAGHLRFFIRKKTVAYYLNDHHGDGVIALCCKVASPLAQAEYVEADSEQYYVPPYIGPKGWIGLRLDRRRMDWPAVQELLFESYRLQAPKRLARRLP